jgi:hypothetical protein
VDRHPLIEGFCNACNPADRRPPWQWCEEHVRVDETSPLPGRWRSDASPWVRSAKTFASEENGTPSIPLQPPANVAKHEQNFVPNCGVFLVAREAANRLSGTLVELEESAQLAR